MENAEGPIVVPNKVVNIIENLYNLYNNTECAVVINGHLTEWFSVKVGVCQDVLCCQHCLMYF